MIRQPTIESDGDIMMGEEIYTRPNSVQSYPFKILNPSNNETTNRTVYLEINTNHTITQVRDVIWPQLQRYFNIDRYFVVIEMNCGEDGQWPIFPALRRTDLYAYVASRSLSQGGTVRAYEMNERIGHILPQQPAFYVKIIDRGTDNHGNTDTDNHDNTDTDNHGNTETDNHGNTDTDILDTDIHGTDTNIHDTDFTPITYYQNIRGLSGNYNPHIYTTHRIHPTSENINHTNDYNNIYNYIQDAMHINTIYDNNTTDDNNTIDDTDMDLDLAWGNYDTQPQPDVEEPQASSIARALQAREESAVGREAAWQSALQSTIDALSSTAEGPSALAAYPDIVDDTDMDLAWGNYDTQPQPDVEEPQPGDEEVDEDGTKDEDDNIRGNLGGISGEVLEDCHGHRLFYFIRKESAIRIQRNWRIYLDETREKKECAVCYEKFKFMVKNYNCLHTMCSGCYKQWQTRPGGNKCPTCRTTHLEDCLTRDM